MSTNRTTSAEQLAERIEAGELLADKSMSDADFLAPLLDDQEPDAFLGDDENPFVIVCSYDGTRAEAPTAEAALVAADTIARDAIHDVGSLKAARGTIYITERGTYSGILTDFARRGVRDLPVTS